MARSEVRALILAVAGFGVLTNTVGAFFALPTGTSLSAWQLNCLGVGLPTALVGTLAAWHQPRNRIAWLFLSASVGFGLEQLGLAVLAYPASASWAQAAAYAMLLVTPGPLTTIWVLLVLLFPDGHFSRPVWRLYALIAIAVALIASLAEFLIAPPGHLPLEYGVAAPARLAGPFATFSSGLPVAGLDLPGVLLPAMALLALLDRYRHAHGTVQQQIKWLLFAVSLQVAIQLLFFPLLWLGVEEPALVSLLVAPLPTIGAALAIFKYRLWEVDRLLLRTLVFAAFWLVSSAGFLGVAAVAGLAIGGMDLRLLAAVTLSLMAALALQPIRGRLEARIRQLVYGPRPRGYTALARLGEQAPGVLPVGQLAELIAAVARDAVGVDWTSVWLRMEVDKRFLLRLVGEARAEPSCESDSGRVELELWGDQAEPASLASLLPQPAGVVLPLETATELVGFLACGQRDARELSADDHQVLTVIARQAAVLLRHGRLEEELRERLDELRESRQRLVTSQDEQRRRLERDLHDGVQQQLVSLAARMRQLSRLGSASRPAELESLADQAEEAVFAMQDLARGIYPSVLADQGLAAALRAQAARLPLELRLEVEPGLADARFERDSEACLYFVAMEALTNAQKHASCSAVTVSLHSRAQPRGVVLEVHDDGRGFNSKNNPTPVGERRHSGSGLQNMRDRLAALGGQLDVRSAPGAGTWIVANLPVSAEILPFQRPGIVSRR
jgi:signal transduction histidine kinase